MELTRLEYAKAHAAGFAEFLGHGLLDSDEGEGGRQTQNQAGDVPFGEERMEESARRDWRREKARNRDGGW